MFSDNPETFCDSAPGLWPCLALRHCRRLGPKAWKILLDHYGSADEAVLNSDEWENLKLIDPKATAEFRQGLWRAGAQKELELARESKACLITWDDPRYPVSLRHIFAPPLLLYALGDLSLLKNAAVAVVGARKASPESLDITAEIAAGLSKAGITVISGLAVGIDGQAHQAAMTGPGSSIAVMATGIDLLYPEQNRSLWLALKEQGLLLTEFAPGTPALPAYFPQRNRIISALSLGVVLTQAGIKSGALITANLAMEYGREVFALPGPARDEHFAGCNAIIRQGAHLTQSLEDIIGVLSRRLKEYSLPIAMAKPAEKNKAGPAEAIAEKKSVRLPIDLSPDEKAVVALLQGQEQAHIDQLTRELDLPAAKINSLLLILEIKGLIGQKPGMMYYKR